MCNQNREKSLDIQVISNKLDSADNILNAAMLMVDKDRCFLEDLKITHELLNMLEKLICEARAKLISTIEMRDSVKKNKPDKFNTLGFYTDASGGPIINCLSEQRESFKKLENETKDLWIKDKKCKSFDINEKKCRSIDELKGYLETIDPKEIVDALKNNFLKVIPTKPLRPEDFIVE